MNLHAQFPTSLFDIYVATEEEKLNLLRGFLIPESKSWIINWEQCIDISKESTQKKWNIIPVFEDLFLNKKCPGVYYFTVDESDAQVIHDSFTNSKRRTSEIRISSGLNDERFLSISHVPKNFQQSSCIYVGSTTSDVYARLIQHLGFGGSKRTGALYLYQVLSELYNKPQITFHYHILEKKYQKVTKNIECVIQDKLKPFIGKRAL